MTTNNRMELTAAIKALEMLREPCEVELYTDSAYLCNGFNNGWIWNWLKTAGKQPPESLLKTENFGKRLLELQRVHKLDWRKVKGHADNPYNNRCDKLATTAAANLKKQN